MGVSLGRCCACGCRAPASIRPRTSTPSASKAPLRTPLSAFSSARLEPHAKHGSPLSAIAQSLRDPSARSLALRTTDVASRARDAIWARIWGWYIGRGWVSEGRRSAPVASVSAAWWSIGTIGPVLGCAGAALAAAGVLVVGLFGCRLRGGRESRTCQSADVRGSGLPHPLPFEGLVIRDVGARGDLPRAQCGTSECQGCF